MMVYEMMYPLHYAAMRGKTKKIGELLNDGIYVDDRDVCEFTPLILAAWGGHLKICKRLIVIGANINSKTCNGWTPLFMATSSSHSETAEFLKSKGAKL